MIRARDWDWLCFQRKNLIGSHIVQFKCDTGSEKVYDVGVITNIKMQNDFFQIDVDGKNWFMYGFDIILPDITEEDDNITIHDKILGIRSIILVKSKAK